MKRIYFIVAVMLFTALTGFAQRSYDTAIELIEPATGYTIVADATFNVKFKVTNNGPDDILAGDTLIWGVLVEGNLISQDGLVLTADIASGSDFVHTFPYGLTDGSSATGLNFCVLAFVMNAGNAVESDSTNQFGCQIVDYSTAVSIGGSIKEASDEVSVYPNPASDVLNIEYTLVKESAVNVRIYDLTGKVVKVMNLGTEASGRTVSTIDVGDLPEGIYLCEVNAGDSIIQKKVIITK